MTVVSIFAFAQWSKRAGAVQRQLEAAVTSGHEFFSFQSATPFAWDRMFVFDCYTHRSDVEKALGFEWPDYRRTSIESSDAVCLVVFVSGGEVVYWYEQPRSIELGYLANGKGYSPADATFYIARDGERVELVPLTAGD